MWEMPWTDSIVLVTERINEEFIKRGQGDLRVHITIPMNWIDEFDIFSNFRLRLQDPFGLSADGSGEIGRYYYIESLTYDFMNQRIAIVGIDLQFILRQIMIVAHCGDVADSWATASEFEKLYAYVGSCATESFANGDPLKRVASCD
ncbi:MAG: hypothetical protein GTO41_22415 [Burkholderiales bacterium]|nr:hypothetical protein [Burkholderiales bacterium]